MSHESEITAEAVQSLLRDHVLGPRSKLPNVDTCAFMAIWLNHLRLIYRKDPAWKLEASKAADTWGAVALLCTELPAWLSYIEKQRGALGLYAETEEKRRARATVKTALAALKDLREIDLSFTPVLPHPQLAVSTENWHAYAGRLALEFIKAIEPTTPGLRLSNKGPVAKFVFHAIPWISGESPPTVGAVGKHIMRKAGTKKAAKGDKSL